MTRIFISRSSPFLRFARIIHLGPVNPEEFRPWITRSLNHYKVFNGEELAKEIVQFTLGHPYYTQLLTQQAVFLNDPRGTTRISFQTILAEALALENDYLEKLWESISVNRQQKAVILAIAAGEESLYSRLDRNRINVYRTLKQLSGSGTIFTTPSVRLTDPLFREWIRKRVLKM